MSAVQRPISARCLEEKAQKPHWKRVPSWFLIAEDDRMVHPATQKFEAERMRATIHLAKVDHVQLITTPGLVIDIITQAAMKK